MRPRRGLSVLLAMAVLGGGWPASAQPTDEEDAPVVVPSPYAGLDEQGLRARLGEPALARAEGAGALWTYRLTGCALFVYFADEGEGLRVTGASSGPRRHGEPTPPVERCLHEAAAGGATARAPVPDAQPAQP